MLDLLNDDCQLAIISYLGLKDQQALCLASINYSSRLKKNVMYAWQRQINFNLDKDNINEFEMNPELFDTFLCCISPTLQQLELNDVTLEQLTGWQKYSFSKMKMLKYTLNSSIKSNADEALKVVIDLFPNLTSAKPYGTVDYTHITKWTQLRQLDLIKCLSTGENEKSLCKCQMLEEIMHCKFFNDDVYDNLIRLPKLRTLCCEGTNELLNMIGELRGQDIYELTFHDCIWHYYIEVIQQFQNLRQLTIFDYGDGFDGYQVLNLVSLLPKLEQLNLVGSQLEFWETEETLWDTISSCPTLKAINIAGMRLKAKFFKFNRHVMNEVLDLRSEPLTLNFHDNGGFDNLIRRNFQHPKLTLSFEPLYVDVFNLNNIEIKFVPLVN